MPLARTIDLTNSKQTKITETKSTSMKQIFAESTGAHALFQATKKDEVRSRTQKLRGSKHLRKDQLLLPKKHKKEHKKQICIS